MEKLPITAYIYWSTILAFQLRQSKAEHYTHLHTNTHAIHEIKEITLGSVDTTTFGKTRA